MNDQSQNIETISEAHEALRAFEHSGQVFARSLGIEPAQYSLLVAVRALSLSGPPNLTAIATTLSLKHHSVVELVTRAVAASLVVRERSASDRREVFVVLTTVGADVLDTMAEFHAKRIAVELPRLIETLVKLSAPKMAGARRDYHYR